VKRTIWIADAHRITAKGFTGRAGTTKHASAIERIDCIKIDAEGSDFEIIKGARSTIEKFRPVIMLETDNLARFAGSKSDVISFLERLGYFTSEFKFDHSIDLLCMPTEKAAGI
jgi:Methyltransferase FkbM domain